MAELIGGFGVVSASAPLASMRSKAVNRRLAAEEAAAEAAADEGPLPPMTVPEGPRTLGGGGFPPPITPQGYESTVTMDTPQYGAETAEGTIVQPLGLGSFSVTSVTTPQFDPIEKVVPTDDEAVNMDGVTDAVDNKAATVGVPRTLSKKNKRKLN